MKIRRGGDEVKAEVKAEVEVEVEVKVEVEKVASR